jgi:hypothetical protein
MRAEFGEQTLFIPVADGPFARRLSKFCREAFGDIPGERGIFEQAIDNPPGYDESLNHAVGNGRGAPACSVKNRLFTDSLSGSARHEVRSIAHHSRLAMKEYDEPSGGIAFPHNRVACSKTADHVLSDLLDQVTGYAFEQGDAGQVRLLPRRSRLVSIERGQPRLFGLPHTVNSEDKSGVSGIALSLLSL